MESITIKYDNVTIHQNRFLRKNWAAFRPKPNCEVHGKKFVIILRKII